MATIDFNTTHVGSLPRPRDLTPQNVGEKVREVVALQVRTGVGEVTDGEYGRNIYFGDISGLPGFRQKTGQYEFSAGDVFPTPILVGRVEYDFSKPIIAKQVVQVKEALQELGVKRRIKATVPSPSMMLALYPDSTPAYLPPSAKAFYRSLEEGFKDAYPTKDAYAGEVTKIVVNEAKAAFRAGADTVQFDAPTLLVSASAGKDFIRYQVQLDNEALASVKGEGTRGVHGCFGNGWNTQSDTTTHWAKLLPELFELKADIWGPFELFDGIRDFRDLKAFKDHAGSISKDVTPAIGIVSVKTRNVEPVETIRERYDATAEALGRDFIGAPGCGFASGADETVHSIEGARRKLTNLAGALRRE